MATNWYRSPWVWASILVGIALVTKEDEGEKAVQGTYSPAPITDRKRTKDSMVQLRAQHKRAARYRSSTSEDLYETEVYQDGKWTKVTRIKVKGIPQRERVETDWEEVYDQVEGK